MSDDDKFLMNRMHNARNPNQGSALRVLCVCSAGLLRSPTMANVLHDRYGFNTRAAGAVDAFALIKVDPVLFAWADQIVCVNDDVARALEAKFHDTPHNDILVLNIPDQYEWNDKRLKDAIIEQYSQKAGLSF